MRLRLVALFVLVGLSAAACTGGSGPAGDTPSPTPTGVTSTHSAPTSTPPSTPASSSPTVPTTGPNVRPGEKPPALAAIGHHNGPAGAIIFATYWMQSIDWAYATTDSALSRTLFSSSCTGCTRFLRISIDGVRAAGRHFIGGRIRLLHTVIAPNDHRNGATAVADVTVTQRPLEEVDSTGAVRQRTQASGHVTFRTWLRWLGDRWTVVEWKIADPR